MSLHSAIFPSAQTPQSPLPCAETLSDAHTEAGQMTLDGQPPELMALQAKAMHSVELCQQTIADFMSALGDDDDEMHRHRAETAANQLFCGAAEAAALEAFFTSAKKLIICLLNSDQPKILSLPEATPADDKLPGTDLKSRLERLSGRQKCVFQLVSQGLPNKIIAYELGLAETTIKAHVSAILQKLGIPSRARAISLVAKLKARGFIFS